MVVVVFSRFRLPHYVIMGYGVFKLAFGRFFYVVYGVCTLWTGIRFFGDDGEIFLRALFLSVIVRQALLNIEDGREFTYLPYLVVHPGYQEKGLNCLTKVTDVSVSAP